MDYWHAINWPLRETPQGEPLRHLIFHLYPRKGGLWAKHCRRLRRHVGLFTGRRLVHVACDHTTVPVEAVRRELPDPRFEIITSPNASDHERTPFVSRLLPAVIDLDGWTFYAHGKGSAYPVGPLQRRMWAWASRLWMYNCRPSIVDSLRNPRMDAWGCFKLQMPHAQSPWHYSGTYFWFRNSAARAVDWRNLAPGRYAVESWPGRMFDFAKAGSFHQDSVWSPWKRR